MKRPEITQSDIVLAAHKIVQEIDTDLDLTFDDIIKCYASGMNGYELAQKLEANGYTGRFTVGVVIWLEFLDRPTNKEFRQQSWSSERFVNDSNFSQPPRR